MDEIKRISLNYIDELAVRKGFAAPLLVKDYILTSILYLIKDIEGIYFKGGTAINKILLDHPRLSEDIDFSITRSEKEVQKEIQSVLENNGFVESITEGKNVDGFLRMIVDYNLDSRKGEIFIDLNKRGKLMIPPEVHAIPHFYQEYIPEFSMKTVGKEEMVAEKVAATIGRNKPRDHYDVYNIIRAGMYINIGLVKEKCKSSEDEFSIIKMFNKAKTLKNRWDEDMAPLLAKEIPFQSVMKYLAKHFKLKEAKEHAKSKKVKKSR